MERVRIKRFFFEDIYAEVVKNSIDIERIGPFLD